MTMTHISNISLVRDNFRKIKDKIADAAIVNGRNPESVKLVAVTKTASPDEIRCLLEMGHTSFGESRVQQMLQRVANIEEFLGRRKTLAGAAPKPAPGYPSKLPEPEWHMIGHLQRNKAKQVVKVVHLVHGVDSLRLAEELDGIGARQNQVIDVLLQVNASNEITKHGIAAPAVIHMAEQVETMMHLRFRGLMTMAPNSDNPIDAELTFSRTADIYRELVSTKIGGPDCDILSMGMSNDFELAIKHGANLVRIGRSIFGEMQQPPLSDEE